MINACLSLYDENGDYSKYVGVVICSLLENTKEQICIYILHDKTLTQNNRERLQNLVCKYQQKICFCNVVMEESLENLKAVKNFSIGTLFRLKIADILPRNVDKIIYLDADIVVNLDIDDLWKFDLGEKTIGASLDLGIKEYEINVWKNGISDYKKYFNAGVLLINLNQLRERYDLFIMSVQFFKQYPECGLLDQDALNYIFKDEVVWLPGKYNQFVWMEKEARAKIGHKIYHYTSGPSLLQRINDVYMDDFDRLFFSYLFKTPWGSGLEILDYYVKKVQKKNDMITFMQTILRESSGKRKVFWGIKGNLHFAIMKKFILNKGDYYVDNNYLLWGRIYGQNEIKSPSILCDEDLNKTVVIVTTMKYDEVKKQLESYGYVENSNFFDGRKLLLENEGGYII